MSFGRKSWTWEFAGGIRIVDRRQLSSERLWNIYCGGKKKKKKKSSNSLIVGKDRIIDLQRRLAFPNSSRLPLTVLSLLTESVCIHPLFPSMNNFVNFYPH